LINGWKSLVRAPGPPAWDELASVSGPKLIGSGSASSKRILGTIVQTANFIALVSHFSDFETGANEELRWKLLDRETDGICGPRKSPVPKRLAPAFQVPSGEQFGFGAVIKQLRLPGIIKGIHSLRPSDRQLAPLYNDILCEQTPRPFPPAWEHDVGPDGRSISASTSR